MININEKTYNTVLTEAAASFQAKGLSVLNEGFKDILHSPALLSQYTDLLLEGASPNSAATMRALMENANVELLRESTLSAIDPVASLSMPLIRRLWPLAAVKDAIKTEVATSPAFVISYIKPYLTKGDGVRLELPLKQSLENHSASGKEGTTKVALLTGPSAVATIDFTDFLTVETSSAAKIQPMSGDVRIVKVNIGNAEHPVNHRLNIVNGADFTVEGIDFFVRADLRKGKVTVVMTGAEGAKPVSVFVTAFRSEEYNESTYSVEMDVVRKDVRIPEGRHLNAPLPVEAIKDLMALYNIDGTSEVIDIMTNVFAMDLDKEILEFLDGSFNNLPGNIFGDLGTSADYSFTFDVRPQAGFAGGPKAWREEFKLVIDFLAQKIKNNTYLQNGIFTIVGNPLDVQLITNIDWKYRSGQGTIDGVEVDYSVGIYQGANTYRIISSVHVREGELYLVFTPNAEKQMTYKYYPYQFNVEKGYIDPNRSRVPSIMMTKRHTIEEYIPAIGKITIINNTGAGQFLSGNWGEAVPNTPWGQE